MYGPAEVGWGRSSCGGGGSGGGGSWVVGWDLFGRALVYCM
jgi:hypothetical protein